MKTVTDIMVPLILILSCVLIQAKLHEAATIVRRQAQQPQPNGKQQGVEDKYKFGVGMYMDLGPGPFGYGGMPYGGGGYGMPYGGGYGGMPYGMPYGGGGGYGMPYGR